MKKTVLVDDGARGSCPRRAAAALTPEQTLDRRGIGELELSPDDTRLVFTVTEPVKGTARQRNLWMLDVASGNGPPADVLRQRATRRRAGRPTAASIAFLSDRDGAAQLYLLPMRGGEAEKHHRPQGPDRVVPLVAGRPAHIALADAGAEARRAAAAREGQGRCARRGERGSSAARLDGRVASRADRPITSAPFRIGQIEFAPGGDRLIAAASAKPHEDRFNEAIYAVDLQDGRFTPIADAARADGRDGAVARRQDHRVRLRARRRPGGARPLPAAGRRRRRAQPHRRDHRSADQPAEMDRRPAARASAWRAGSRRRSPSSARDGRA